MADERSASREDGRGEEPEKRPAGAKEVVRTRQSTLMGFAVGKKADPAQPPASLPGSATSAPRPPPPAPRRPVPPPPGGAIPGPKPPKPPKRSFPKPPKDDAPEVDLHALRTDPPPAALADDEVDVAPDPASAPGPDDGSSTDPTGSSPAAIADLATNPLTPSPDAREEPKTQTAAPAFETDPVGLASPEDTAARTQVQAQAFPDDDDEVDAEALMATEPALESPPELAGEETRPAASLPRAPPDGAPAPLDLPPPAPRSAPGPRRRSIPHPARTSSPEIGERTSDPGDLPVEPTRVVSGDAATDAAQTYSYDPASGQLELQVEAGPRLPRKRTSPMMWALLVLALLIGLSGLGFLAWAIVVTKTAETAAAARPARTEAPASTEPAAPDEEEAAGSEPAAEAAEASPDPGEATGEGEAEGDSEDAEPIDEEDPDGAAPVAGERVEVEDFELDLPRLSRRARRLTTVQRRRQSTRLKAAALRAYRADDYAGAERLYRQAMGFNTWDVAAVEGLARATAQQGRFSEAVAWAELAVSRNPRSATAYRVLGDVWRQAGHPEEAADAYRRGVARAPDDRWLNQRLRDVAGEGE